MKIVNPYSGVNWSNQQKANLHCHTALAQVGGTYYGSDGDLTPQQVIDMYHGKGYKILAITDHDYASHTQITTYPWSVFGRDPATLGMLAVQGKELSNGNHRNSLFCDLGGFGSSVSASIAEITLRGGIAFINHPGHYSESANYYIERFLAFKDVLIGMEIHSYGNSFPDELLLWDAINSITIPQGKVVFGAGNDDMHSTEEAFVNYQFILSNTISEADVKSALKNGHTYFSYESGGSGNAKAPRITNISVDEIAQTITITVDGGTIKWITEGTIEVGTGNTFNYSNLNKCFVRAEITNEFGITHTQPFTFENEFSTVISEVKIWDGEVWVDIEANYWDESWVKITEIRQK